MENTDKLSNLKKDEEFQNLIQPLSGLAYHRLSTRILEEGFATIRVWNGIVLNDLQILEVCLSSNMACRIEELHFATRNEAISYICTEELRRDDLNNEYTRYLIGKKYLAELKGTHSLKTSKVGIASQIGHDLHIAPGTVQKYSQYAESLDALFVMRPDVARHILTGSLRISHESTIELARLPREELLTLSQILAENQSGHYSYADIRHEIRWKNYTATTTKPRPAPNSSVNPEIRKMPQYDPDAQISSLTLTIPSWVSSIKRALNQTDFMRTTSSARFKLSEQLSILEDTIHTIQHAMEENGHE